MHCVLYITKHQAQHSLPLHDVRNKSYMHVIAAGDTLCLPFFNLSVTRAQVQATPRSGVPNGARLAACWYADWANSSAVAWLANWSGT